MEYRLGTRNSLKRVISCKNYYYKFTFTNRSIAREPE